MAGLAFGNTKLPLSIMLGSSTLGGALFAFCCMACIPEGGMSRGKNFGSTWQMYCSVLHSIYSLD